MNGLEFVHESVLEMIVDPPGQSLRRDGFVLLDPITEDADQCRQDELQGIEPGFLRDLPHADPLEPLRPIQIPEGIDQVLSRPGPLFVSHRHEDDSFHPIFPSELRVDDLWLTCTIYLYDSLSDEGRPA